VKSSEANVFMIPKSSGQQDCGVSRDFIRSISLPEAKLFMVPKSPVQDETDHDVITSVSNYPDVALAEENKREKPSESKFPSLKVHFDSDENMIYSDEDCKDLVSPSSTKPKTSIFMDPKYASDYGSKYTNNAIQSTSSSSESELTLHQHEDVLTGEWTELNRTVEVRGNFLLLNYWVG